MTQPTPTQPASKRIVTEETVDDHVTRVGNATYGPKAGAISANAFGASPQAAWQTNRDAIQAALDAAALTRGVVTLEPGIYPVKGLVQDSHTTLRLEGVTLRNPDGLSPDVLTARVRTTTGTINAGEKTLTVASADGVEVGTVVAIRAARGVHPTQWTTLGGAVDATQTTGFTLAQTGSSWPSSGWMWVDDEVIRYTGISSGALTGVQRGQFGTAAAAHAAGARIGFAVRHYGEVVAINGTTLTLDEPSPKTVTGAEVSVGIIDPVVEGGVIDGNHVSGGSPSAVYALSWPMVSYGVFDRPHFRNTDIGAVSFSNGARHCVATSPAYHDCGVITGPDTGKGAGVWFYAGARDNHVISPTFTGDFWCAVYWDDRTSIASEWDDQPVNNRVDHPVARTPRRGYAPMLVIAGGSDNLISGGLVSEAAIGFKVEEGGQGITGDGTKPSASGNRVVGTVFDTITPWILEAAGNTVDSCRITSRALNAGTNHGSQVINSSLTPGGPLVPQTGVKTVNGAAPDANGNVVVSGGGGGSVEPVRLGIEALASKAAFGGAGELSLAVVSDSTANDVNDWVRIFTKKYGSRLPSSCRREYHAWSTANTNWIDTVDAEGGTSTTGVVLEDDFSTVGAVPGSTPDVGPVWVGAGTDWTSDGTYATHTGAGSAGSLKANVGSKDATLRAEYSVITSSGASSTRQHRIHIGANETLGTSLYASMLLNTSGSLSFTLSKTLGGSATAIGSAIIGSTDLGVTINSATPQTVIIEVQIAIQNVSLTVTGPNGVPKTVTGTITETEYGNAGTYMGIQAFQDVFAGARLDSVRVNVAASPASDVLEVWNGAIAGAGAPTFDTAKLTQMFGGKHIDLLVVSFGHNNASQSAEQFVTQIGEWVESWKAAHPETRYIIWSSQNPQFPPASTAPLHRARHQAMRIHARSSGWDYLPAFEAFATKPDGGQSLVGADGIHPTTPAINEITGEFGAVLWADTLMEQIDARP